MSGFPLSDSSADAVPVRALTAAALPAWLAEHGDERAWTERHRFTAKAGSFLVLPGGGGALAGVVAGVSEPATPWDFAPLAAGLPAGRYRLEPGLDAAAATHAALGWALGAYRYERYRAAQEGTGGAVLAWPEGADRAYVLRAARATVWVRDAVNTPAGDFGTAALAEAALEVAAAGGAEASVIVGEELVARNYPLIHAVGRAGPEPPRLIDLRWGEAGAPRVTLVGKGVCFDTGGLDLKPRDGMLLMKKDMGGAAHALGLAAMIMDANWNVRLRVLVPAVENAVASNAFHPGDVLPSRKGLFVEVGDTDAEGRLILADALAEADTEAPEVLIDFATLTGSARVALGPDLPALYATDDDLAADFARAGAADADPSWRMPLWDGYDEMIESKIADIDNAPRWPFAGSITAALFLRRFVTASPRWAHLDLYAWNPKARPGRPEGGEAQTLRAAYRVLEGRYGGATPPD